MNGIARTIGKTSRIAWFPWLLLGLILVLALLHEIIQPAWIRGWSPTARLTLWSAMLAFAGIFYLSLGKITAHFEKYEQVQERALDAEKRVAEAYNRLDMLLRVNQKFVQASDENEIIQLILGLTVDLAGARGASFVPLDEHRQPQAAISHGELPFPVMDDLVEYLASPAVRQRCQTCEAHGTLNADRSCPLLTGPISDVIGMFCLPIRRGEKEFGILNLFMPNMQRLDGQTQAFLNALLDETALAMEGVRLRRRELEALRQMQILRQKTDSRMLFTSLLEEVQSSLESDFAILMVQEAGDMLGQVTLGEMPASAQPFIEGVLKGVMASGEPVLLGDVSGESLSDPGIHSILAAPLRSQSQASLGALLLGNRQGGPFHQRQLAVLQTIMGQVALVVENARLIAEVEYQTMIQERTRLAREIHDGLAQTLGFLKLQIAQMQNYLTQNELERLRQSADLCYETLSDAYQDARQAIDGLRISPTGDGLPGWLKQTSQEFKDLTGMPLLLEEIEVRSDLPPEIHAQLIRIVQEALSNVRKHARASAVWINCREVDDDLWIEVRDDGKGFSPEDVPGPSQHGLRGMRERAELVGADYQIISRPDEGTTVRVRLPLADVKRRSFGESRT